MAEELIGNSWNGVERISGAKNVKERRNAVSKLGTGIHLVITKRRRVIRKKKTSYAYQGWCKHCGERKCTTVCSECLKLVNEDVFVCKGSSGNCFELHIREYHDIEL